MRRLPAVLLALLLLSACSGPAKADDGTVTLVTHQSFRISRTAQADFEQRSGLKLRIIRSADAGSLVNQAVLSKGRPQGDVLFGIDNTFLSRAVDAGVFTAYSAADEASVPSRFDAGPAVTPVDFGDVCINYDKGWYESRNLTPPESFADLLKPVYRNQLVVENPAVSSPGLAFLLATVATYGETGWQTWWKQLKANGVLVVDTWDEAYSQRFTVGSRGVGDRPLVVSYASSPPAEVIYATRKPATAPSGVMTSTCFRQIEYAGLLAGAANPAGGRKLIDFLLTPQFQTEMPLQMFVLPVLPDVALPAEFTKYATTPTDPLRLPAAQIAGGRDAWIRQWTAAVLG